MNSTLTCCIAGGLVIFYLILCRRRSKLTLARDANGHEALVVDGCFDGRALFMIDTAYAGPPVISASYLALEEQNANSRLPVADRYLRVMNALSQAQSTDARHRAINRLLQGQGQCRAYTSGCTMRLMGIGTTTETQADMLLCPSLGMGQSNVNGDVLVTNALPGNIHVLTNDYLLHHAPCVICPRAGRLHMNVSRIMQLSWESQFSFHQAHMVGGAFVIGMQVGDSTLNIVIDTGASVALSVGRGSHAKLQKCTAMHRRVIQTGVNGERVCSDALRAPVRIGAFEVGEIEVFANEVDVQGADGYAGMGLLRAFDLWLEPGRIGFRRSGLPPRNSTVASAGTCEGASLPACAAASNLTLR